MTTWNDFSKNNNPLEMENEEITPYSTSPTWFIQQGMLNIYLLLTHRIKGLGWNLEDFWNADTWTTSFLYCTEMDLIEEEDKAFKKSSGDPTAENAKEVEELVEEMYANEG